jgi:hypothetical protein
MRHLTILTVTLCLAAASLSCGGIVQDQSSPPMFVVVNLLQGQEGGGTATLALVPKRIGTTAPTTAPSTNEVTLTRYHVAYTRADGRNTPGVDVPYPFDGAVTGTIQIGTQLTLRFELVRIVATQEPPLAALASTNTVLSTIAYVTFYGNDLVGSTFSATGTIQIDVGSLGTGS